MLLTFIHPWTVFKKTAVLGSIIMVLVFALFIFNQNFDRLEALKYFKPYYLKAYGVAYSHNWKNYKIPTPTLSHQVSYSQEIRPPQARAVPVLLYHGIVEDPDGESVTFDNFKEHMFALKEHGYQTATIEEFLKFVRGEAALPERSFLLTFDDGIRSSYYPVDPILKALGYNAVMYAIWNRSNTPGSYHLNIEELKMMQNSGRWDIESHGIDDHDPILIGPDGSRSHYLSHYQWLSGANRLETEEEFRNRIRTDLGDAKVAFEQLTGDHILSFAFPFSDYGQNVAEFPEIKTMVLETVSSIYPLAFYQVRKGGNYLFNYPGTGEFMMKRISLQADWSAEDLIEILELGSPKDPSNFRNPGNITQMPWVSGWGKFDLENNAMRIGADPTKTGGFVFLEGSYDWTDYSFKTAIDRLKGSNIFLVARYANESNFVMCSYSEKLVQIQQVLNGTRRVIKGIIHLRNLPKEDFNIGINVRGRAVECLMGDNVILETQFLDESLDNGGIGFKTWDIAMDNSEIAVHSVSIQEY